MKFLRKVFTLLLAILLGFWLASANILNGTKTGEVMETIVNYLPDRNDLQQTPLLEDIYTPAEGEVKAPQESAQTLEANDSEVDAQLIGRKIIELVNELRAEKGASPVASNEMLQAAATIRAVETEESFSHTRPDGTDAFTVFEEEGIPYPYRAVGENLGMATYYLSDEEMAELLFNGWVESEGHHENMIRPEYDEIGIGVHYDGEILYVTQLFGTQS